MTKELLPLGSVIYLEEATTKLMIVGRGPIFESDGENVYSDYVGVIYPEGINPEDAIFSITKILKRYFLKATKMKKKSFLWKCIKVGNLS